MSEIIPSIKKFAKGCDAAIFDSGDILKAVEALTSDDNFKQMLLTFTNMPAFSRVLGREFADKNAVTGISACRILRGSLNLPMGQFFVLLNQVISALETSPNESPWRKLADKVLESDLADTKLISFLTQNITDGSLRKFYTDLAASLVLENPHAIYPTSNYRESGGLVESTPDHQTVEAVMSFSTFSTIKIVDHSLRPESLVLSDIYKPLGRCICIVDENVESHYGDEISDYFDHHGIKLERLVYRAMEIDKNIGTVEKMLGDFKHLGVSRNEPILIIGGGVLSDTGGLASALYGRNTPYVMLSTSIVTGIDAGPSPRTCCDGFGYKNLLGAYHPPVISITDRFFFKTLREGWLRHGIAEIIKMAVVKNLELFEDLEAAQADIIPTRFGTMNCEPSGEIQGQSQKILGGSLRSYIEAEYDNLYETHQCRPHAYGHTWSPGFEIEAGLLHGHAVAIGMGFGAYLSYKHDWISSDEFHRILKLMDGFGLSLWHDVLKNRDVMRAGHDKIIQKRGGNLVAPLPKGGIGHCGYLNELSVYQLHQAIDEYEQICAEYPRKGHGIEPLCSDVGLEDPSTIASPEVKS